MVRLQQSQMRRLVGGDDQCDQIMVSALAAASILQFEVAAGLMAAWYILGCKET